MREIIVFTVLYGAVVLVLRRLGGANAAAAWIQEWGRRTATASRA